MTRWPRYCSPGWLLSYAVSAILWILIFEVTPLPVIVAGAALGLIGMFQLGSWLMGGSPPENR